MLKLKSMTTDFFVTLACHLKMKLFISLFVFGVLTFASGTTYEGFRVLRVIPKTLEVLERIQYLSTLNDVSLWTTLRGLGRPVDVMVGPKAYDHFLSELQDVEGEATLLIEDVQKLIDENFQRNEVARMKSKENEHKGRELDNTYYRTLDEINEEMDSLEAEFPDVFSSSIIGTTYEGRDIRLMKVSSSGTDTLPAIWIDCGIHAREWITHATCLYILDQLSGTDAEASSLLETFDFYINPVSNPDGYEFTWTDDRLWRKNRSPNDACFGVDLNRNFDSNFGGVGSSNQPCFDTYHGPSSFSELETQAIRDAVESVGRFISFYNVHSYSQLWMTPYGYTTELPADYDEMDGVARVGVNALYDVYGTSYEHGNIADVIYEASGGSVDWTYDTAGILYSFALELRDTGANGFLLPEDQIEPTGIETWAGIKAAIAEMQISMKLNSKQMKI